MTEPDAFESEHSLRSGWSAPDPQSVSLPTGVEAMLEDHLNKLRSAVPEIFGAMVSTTEGVAIANNFPELSSSIVAAMCAELIRVGVHVTGSTGLGEPRELVIRAHKGYMAVFAAGHSTVLCVSGPPNLNLGLLGIEARRAAARIGKVLDFGL